MIIDSNIIIYYIDPSQIKLQNYLTANINSLTVSAISHLEVLGYHKISAQDKTDFANFFKSIKTKGINKPIVEQAILLRQQKKMSVGDAIIAATALIYNQPLLTNEGDFKHIVGLTIIPMSSI